MLELSPREIADALRDIEVSTLLHPIEREIAQNLAERPLGAWCSGCHRMFRRIHEKAKGTTL